MQDKIEKTKIIVVTTFIVLIVITIIDAFSTSNEFGLADTIMKHLMIPIVILSTAMSVYWVLLTDDFWLIYEGSDTEPWTKIKTGLKFLVWIPGMALYFFSVTQAILSIYNRGMGEEKSIIISGQIVGKDVYKSSGKNRGYFKINEIVLRRNVEIEVDEGEFEVFNKGDMYQTERKIGALGIIYENK
jgi:hypothetical protein